MAKRSKFNQLPEPVKAEIVRLWSSNRYPLDELLERLRLLDGDVSRSGLHRGLKEYAKTTERYRKAQEYANHIMDKAQAGDADMTQLLSQLVKSQAFHTLHAIAEAEVATVDEEGNTNLATNPMGLMLLAKMVEHVSRADKNNLEFRKKIEDEAKAMAADAMESVAIEAGLSKDTIQKFRANILGIEAK